MGSDALWKFVDLEERLHAQAAEKAGCDDFGDPSYREGLRQLLRAYDEEARFTADGRNAARYDLLDTLIKRLRSERLCREHAASIDYEIRRPIVILGLVRTGSTALHYLMGHDPGVQALPFWLAENPQPRPPRGEWEAHPHFQRTLKQLHAIYADDPSRKSMHFMGADLPEECRHLLAQSFTDDRYIVGNTIPSYARWYEGNEHPGSYARHARLIKLIGSSDPARRWLLKYPVHLRQLRCLLRTYPDACVIQTHRDPWTVIRSYTNMVASYRSFFEGEADRTAIARAEMESWAGAAERAIPVRGEFPRARFYDLHFGDFMADPIGAVKRIYAVFDQELSAEGEAALRAWQQANPQGAHGEHAYGGDDIGVTRDEVHARFAAYMRHFGVDGRTSSAN